MAEVSLNATSHLRQQSDDVAAPGIFFLKGAFDRIGGFRIFSRPI